MVRIRALRPRRRGLRGIAPIIGVILLIAITLVLIGVLYAIRIPTPPIPTQINYTMVGASEQVFGDGTDCTTVDVGHGGTGVQECYTLPAFFVIITSTSPVGLPVASLQFTVFCNGTVYLNATLQQMEWVPGEAGNPGAGSPVIGTCGSFVPPPRAYFNRLAFFDQLTPGALTLEPGDQIVVFMNPSGPSSTCPTLPTPPTTVPYWWDIGCDEDYHGIPPWCFTNPSACPIELSYAGSGAATSGTVISFDYGPLFPG